jgi:hypothetical protein
MDVAGIPYPVHNLYEKASIMISGIDDEEEKKMA